MKHLYTAQEKRAWNVYTKHTLLSGSGDIELSDREVLEIAESIQAVKEFVTRKKSECKKGVKFSVTVSRGGNAPSPWVRAIGEVSVEVTTDCKNGCFVYTYKINDPYDFDVKGLPGFTSRSFKNECITIGVRTTELCLRCDWKTFNHKGTYSSR